MVCVDCVCSYLLPPQAKPGLDGSSDGRGVCGWADRRERLIVRQDNRLKSKHGAFSSNTATPHLSLEPLDHVCMIGGPNSQVKDKTSRSQHGTLQLYVS